MSKDTEATAEAERLRKRNAGLERRVAWRRGARRGSSAFLLVLGCALAVLSLVAIWLRVTLLDTDRYVNTVAPIAADPAVQRTVAQKLETAISRRVDFAALAREALPDRADVLAPAIERGAQSVIADRVNEFTRSPRFQQLWVGANRRAHTRLVELLTGGRSKRLVLDEDTLYLDLSPAVNRVKTGLQQRGLTRIADAIPPGVDGRIVLVQSDALVKAQGSVKLLKGVAIVLPLLALLCLLGSVLAAHRRRRALVRVGIGLALAMLALIAALAVARSAYLDALNQNALPRDAAAAIFDTLVALLRHGVRIAVLAAAVLSLLAVVAGLPLRTYAVRGWNAFATSTRRQWVAAHEKPLMITAGAVGMLVLLLWNPLTGGVVLIDLLAVGAAIAVVALLSKPAEPVAEPLGADDRGVLGGHP